MASFPPQLPNESSQAYEAACLYFGMGADRSQEAVSDKLAKSRQLLSRWSAQHNWIERARQYDADVAEDIAAEHTRRYLADLEDHKTRYAQAGKVLFALAQKLARRFNDEIDGLEITPNTLAVLNRTYQVAGDLEAHALGVEQLLPKLAEDQP